MGINFTAHHANLLFTAEPSETTGCAVLILRIKKQQELLTLGGTGEAAAMEQKHRSNASFHSICPYMMQSNLQVPGIDLEEQSSQNKKKKKKKKNAQNSGTIEYSSEEVEESKEEINKQLDDKLDPVRDEGPKEYKSLEEVNKRIKAVTKKLKQAQQISADMQNGTQVNDDQRRKVESIPLMEAELNELQDKLQTLNV
ncbi:hypothetical protein GUITHDRAFT_138136 [Guillardia theta CCMP2712]|uniref:Uncharacterized protein n=2 Tax=Guillardia theta TaxID=55529 RepID=L1JCZ5_GUITC|nr:hypothetical protein GUITHDRAFT_138136 [Guillardia theta CCMP2712]EKX46376.1 hypothetical protein GUITHDRAFT_138136 [Guillardia theta CCMP2712]|eukprot:XP_005833356.1 hypothetical protein GUITHDRAFT_138136 [Guillardia theta CCMP2712]